MFQIVTVSILLVAVSLWLKWRKNKFSFFDNLGIPGPKPSLFFGNIWEMYRKDPLQCQQEWIKKYGKVLGYYYGTVPILLIADIEYMKEVLVKNFNVFIDRPVHLLTLRSNKEWPTSLLALTGEHWKEVRKLISPAFTTGKLKSMTPLMNSAMKLLMDEIGSRCDSSEGFDIYELFKGLTMDVIGRTAFGIESNVQDNPDHPLLLAARTTLSRPFKKLLHILGYSFTEFKEVFYQAMLLRVRIGNKGSNPILDLMKISSDVVKLRKKDSTKSRPDLLQMLIDAQSSNEIISDSQLEATLDGEARNQEPEETKAGDINKLAPKKSGSRLTDYEVIGNAMLFFLAGYETTSTALAYIAHVLVTNQDVQDKLRQEIGTQISKDEIVDYGSIQNLPYMDRVVMECLRLYSPIYNFVSRCSNRDFQLGQWLLPAGTTVQIPMYVLHHDPELWPDPEKFDPDRFLPENRSPDHSVIWQPFGVGPRNCIGMRFALTEIKLALANILKRYKFEPCIRTEAKNDLSIQTNINSLIPIKGVFCKATRVL